MSDTTVTPADVAPKPSDVPTHVGKPSTTVNPEPQTDPAQETDWKAEARKWEQRAKENKATAEAATQTEAEKVATRLAEVEKRAADAEARATRREIALEHKLSKDDAALLDSLADEGAMKALAARLAGESDKKRNHVPREGNTPSSGDDVLRNFTRGLFGSQDD